MLSKKDKFWVYKILKTKDFVDIPIKLTTVHKWDLTRIEVLELIS